MATRWVVLYMINIRPSPPVWAFAFSFIILFRSSSIFLRASSRAFAASDFSFGLLLFEGVFLETVLLFFTGSGFFTTQSALLSSTRPSNLLWICSTWMLTMSQNPARSWQVGTKGSSSLETLIFLLQSSLNWVSF